MFITNNYVSFHLLWKEILVKCQKVFKYYVHDCTFLIDVLTAKEADMQKYTKYTGSSFADINFYFSHFSFKVPVENVVIDVEELHVLRQMVFST